jgi:hypothetical protein
MICIYSFHACLYDIPILRRLLNHFLHFEEKFPSAEKDGDFLFNCLPVSCPSCRFDEEKDISSIFEEIWEDNISSTSVALGLYMPEIVARLKEGIGSSSWPQKKKVSISVHSFCLHSLFWSWLFCQVLS